MLVYLNGSILERECAHIAVDDRGFLFGDGGYEVVRAARGRLVAVERHARRFVRTLDGLAIAHPPALAGTGLADISRELLERNGLADRDALIYAQVTRGAAPRTHHYPPPDTPPTVYVSVSPFQPPDAVRARGARVITCPDLRWARCDLKTVNLLPNAMAKQRAVEMGADEAVLLREGVVMEGSASNVFAVLDGVVRTHPLGTRILGGITRELVLEAAASLDLPVAEVPVLADELPRCSELFLTSTTNDVMPIVLVDGRAVGCGRPGEIARRLYDAVR